MGLGELRPRRLGEVACGEMSVRDHGGQTAQRASRRAARQTVAEHHEQQLAALLECVRDAITRLDQGEIDVFDVDALIERYDLAARKLRHSRLDGANSNAPRACWRSRVGTAQRTTRVAPEIAGVWSPDGRREAHGRRGAPSLYRVDL